MRLGVVVELLEGSDGYVRGAKVKFGKTKNIIRCPINQLYPTERYVGVILGNNVLHAQRTLLMTK